jgi:tetratricopeptide (TPR) repeat protein
MQRTMFSFFISLLVIALVRPAASGQQAEPDQPQPLKPLRPETREDRDHAEALKLYALGLLRQENDRLVEAARLFEEALKLEPQAAPLQKTLVPLYLALGRKNDALVACRKAIELAPGDYGTWTIYARQLKSLGRLGEARDAMLAAVKSPQLSEHPDIRVQILFDLGVISEELKDTAGALDAFQEVVKSLENPQMFLETHGFNRDLLREPAATVYERMIRICIETRDYDHALGFFADAQAKYPAASRQLNFVVAKIYFERGDPAKALELVDAHLRTQPRGSEGYELRSAILKGLHREEQILPSLERFAEQDAQNTTLQLFLAREYARFGRPGDAERVYIKLLERSPTPEIYQGLFRLYKSSEASGGTRKVLELLDTAVSRATRKESPAGDAARFAARARDMIAAVRSDHELSTALVSASRTWLSGGSRLHYQTLCFLAALASRSRQLAEAELLYRHCLDYPDARAQEFAIYRGLIQVLWKTHKYQELAEVCQSGLKQAQAANHILFHLHLSQVWLILGKIEEAVAEAGKAVDCADDDRRLSARLNRMDVLGRAERALDSIAEGQALLKEYSRPGDVRDIRLRLANVYLASEENEKSEEQLQLILKADPHDSTANNDLGYQWADRGKNLQEAERLIRKAIDLDAQQRRAGTAADEESDNAAYLDSLGWVLFRRGQLVEARQWLEKAAALPGGADDPVVWDHLGDVYSSMHEIARAKIMWQKSFALYETGERRKADVHYKVLKRKLQPLDAATQRP